MSEFPYVLSPKALKEEVKKRKESNVRERAAKYLKEKWGIDADSLPLPEPEEETLTVARQIATSNIEICGLKNLAENYGLDFGTAELTIDNFVWGNPLKKSYVHNRIVNERKIEKKKIAKPKDGEVLRCIKTLEDILLPEYHHKRYYEKVIRKEKNDLSDIFACALSQSLENGRTPKAVWIIENGRSEKGVWDEKEKVYILRKSGRKMKIEEVMEYAEKSKARPDASWYYTNLYLLLPGILCEEMALLVTPWEEDEEKIKSLAKKGYEEVKRATGVYPLTVPFYDPNKNERAKIRFGKNPGCVLVEEEVDVKHNPSGNFYKDSKYLYEELYKALMGE